MECTFHRLLKIAPQPNEVNACYIGTFEIDGFLKYYGLDEGLVPPGRYELIIHDSPKLKRLVPMVKGVQGHNYILIHIGNYPKDTEGCLLLAAGYMKKDFIAYSGIAIDEFYKLFFAAKAKGERCFITYKNFE